MRLDFEGERILAVVAHPDDAELLCAGTLARAKADGAAIGICVMCQGDKGQPARPIKNLAAVRRKEMQASARLLGAETFFAGIPDGTLADVPASRKRLLEIFRNFAPTTVLAHSASDYHPDHRAAGVLAEAASWFSASRGQVSRGKPLTQPPAVWRMDTLGMGAFEPDFFVDISAYLSLKRSMLACHKSQLQRGKDSDFSPLATLMDQQCQARGLQAGVAAAEAFQLSFEFKRLRAW